MQVIDEVTHVFTYLNERDVEFWKVLDELKQIDGTSLTSMGTYERDTCLVSTDKSKAQTQMEPGTTRLPNSL